MTNKVYGITDVIHEVKRMANAMEEILRLVKEDQAQYKNKEEDDDQGNTAIITEERMNEKN